MRIGKFIIGLIAIAGTTLTARAVEPGVVMVDKQGNSTEMAYSQLDRINLTGEGVQLVGKGAVGTAPTVAYADFDRLLIGAEVSGIESLPKDIAFAVWPTVTDGYVNIKSADTRHIYVSSMSGALIESTDVNAGETATIDLSAAPEGVYIVSCGDNSVKIIKKQ